MPKSTKTRTAAGGTGMTELIIFSCFFILVLTACFVLNRSRKNRKNSLLKQRYGDAERKELAEDFALFCRLPTEIRARLEGLMHLFIDEKSFEACGGLEQVTARMQRLIAAQACLLIVGRRNTWYTNLRTILIYPNAFGYDEGGVRLGESWSSGTVILSWQSVSSGAADPRDGHDVSLHEFAHQLDQEFTGGEGLPELENKERYQNWNQVFSAAFKMFSARVEQGKKTVFDSYGATNPAEFFAVGTETFFEKPKQLNERYPELYATFAGYYGLDPLHWEQSRLDE